MIVHNDKFGGDMIHFISINYHFKINFYNQI